MLTDYGPAIPPPHPAIDRTPDVPAVVKSSSIYKDRAGNERAKAAADAAIISQSASNGSLFLPAPCVLLWPWMWIATLGPFNGAVSIAGGRS